MKYFLGIDLGTQSMKGILYDPDGNLVAHASQGYLPDFPKPNWCEQDVNAWIDALTNVISEVKIISGINAIDIGCIGLASQCGGIVPISSDGVPLHKSLLWLDRRAEEQCDVITHQIDPDEVYELVGAPISASLAAAKIAWFRERMPEIYDKAMTFLQPGEFMVYYLTGEIVTDYSHAGIYGLLDSTTLTWSKRMCDLFGIDMEKLPKIRPAADVAGTLKPEVAEQLGLDRTTKVVVGGADQSVASLGSGLITPGDILNVMGTAEIIAGASDHVDFDKIRLLRTHLHVIPGIWQIEQGALISGAAVRWYKDNLARCGFDEINAAAEKAPPGSNGLVFFSGLSGATSPLPHGYGRGIFFGLTMSHDFSHLSRSVFEGCAYGFRDSIESLEKMNMSSGEIIASGGGINSRIWMQIKADMVGKRIKTLKNSDSTPLGAAMLAGIAQGNFANYKEACDKFIEFGDSYEPNPANKQLYDDMYGFYRELFFNSCKLFDRYREL